MASALKTMRGCENDAEKLKYALEYLRDEATRMDLGQVTASIEEALQILKVSRSSVRKERISTSQR
jgi:hypothetical protein